MTSAPCACYSAEVAHIAKFPPTMTAAARQTAPSPRRRRARMMPSSERSKRQFALPCATPIAPRDSSAARRPRCWT
eukprot:2053418-Pleurochrysis_carterae.AAC.2